MSKIFYYNTVKVYRERMGFTQNELASSCGCSRQSINAIENGLFYPSLRLALKISFNLGVRIEELFWLEECNCDSYYSDAVRYKSYLDDDSDIEYNGR